MGKKEKCAEIMGKFFGPATAKMIINSTESDSVILEKCKAKVSGFFGAEKADLIEKYVSNNDLNAKQALLG